MSAEWLKVWECNLERVDVNSAQPPRNAKPSKIVDSWFPQVECERKEAKTENAEGLG